jgi:hypothetical protein
MRASILHRALQFEIGKGHREPAMKIRVQVRIGSNSHEGVYQLPDAVDQTEAIAETMKQAFTSAARKNPDLDFSLVRIEATIMPPQITAEK